MLFIVSTAVLALTANASTIVFNTFGPGHSYNPVGGYNVQGASIGGFEEVAAPFTAAVSGNVAMVELGLTFNPSPVGQGPVNVYLYADANGLPDNANQTLLGSGTPKAPAGTCSSSIVSLSVVSNVAVTMGTNYWLVLKPGGGSVLDLWMFSSMTGAIANSFDDST